MQTLFGEERKKSLLRSGLSMVGNNKRYIFWFWLLNLTLAELGAAAFRRSAHASLDHSLYATGLLRGLDAAVVAELLLRPQFGPLQSAFMPAAYFAVLFFAATALFLPGVFSGYAANYRLPREDFFRACGRNLWRFIRILIVAGIVFGILSGILFGINHAIVKKAGESTSELLPFELRMTGLFIIFLILTTVRIWFDLAEADTVLSDQHAVRKSLATAFRHTFRSLSRLLASYVLITIIAAIILLAGLRLWMRVVSPESIVGAFVISQVILLLLLIPRFWQRGIAVSYWQQRMLAPVAVAAPVTPEPVVSSPAPTPTASPVPPTPA